MLERIELENESNRASLKLVTKKEVARLLACSTRNVERLVATGTLAVVKIRGAVRYRSWDIDQLMMKGAA